ncbi:MAG: DUF4157 domain-containing protein [Thiobacillaceae bacterium]
MYEVLRSPGQPLAPQTRVFLEPRFGLDFSRVQVHMDGHAARSAHAIDALAYTVGHHVVFGTGQYAPDTPRGQRLLAHELTHVAQQRDAPAAAPRISAPSDAHEVEADRAAEAIAHGGGAPSIGSSPGALARSVSATALDCAGGKKGAAANPATALTRIDAHAQGLAQAAAILLAAASAAASLGVKSPSSGVEQSYHNRFGDPPKFAGGFLNRLSGKTRPTREEALADEMDSASDRFQRLADNFDKPIRYRCIDKPDTFAGCDAHCKGRDATTCAGLRAVFLCPRFWTLGDTEKATLLIHESAHMLWANVAHVANFRHAECYASFVADMFHSLPGTPACPQPKP